MNFSNLFAREDIVTQPLFYIFVAFSALLGFAFFRGKRVNDRMFRGAFQDLIDVFRPVDQTFTNIGGSIGYHAQLSARKADVVEKVEATITFLPARPSSGCPSRSSSANTTASLSPSIYATDPWPKGT